jgi:DNA-binding IclR family transcriptional regulator
VDGVWREKLEGKAKDMLEFLAAADRAITKQEIADQLGLDIKGGTFRTYLSKLTANGLVTRERGMFRIAAALAL